MKPLLTEISRAITLNIRPFLLLLAKISNFTKLELGTGLFDEYFINFAIVLSKINPPLEHTILSSFHASIEERERQSVC